MLARAASPLLLTNFVKLRMSNLVVLNSKHPQILAAISIRTETLVSYSRPASHDECEQPNEIRISIRFRLHREMEKYGRLLKFGFESFNFTETNRGFINQLINWRKRPFLKICKPLPQTTIHVNCLFTRHLKIHVYSVNKIKFHGMTSKHFAWQHIL